MRLLVVGAGATGGYFGGRLAQAGRDVTFLVRPARAARLQAEGLQIRSPHGDFTVIPKLVTADRLHEPFDAVLLTVKAYALDAALDDLAPAVGPGTMILPVLNGMRHIEHLDARFGRDAVVGSLCRIATKIDHAGRIVQLSRLHEFVYGEMDGTASPRIRQVDAFMQGAGFDARPSPAITREMWEKWIFLASLGGLTCLMRGNIGEIEAVPGGADLALRFLGEVVDVVSVVGQAPAAAFLDNARSMLTQKNSDMTSSMYRDLLDGNPVEADQILGDLLVRARSRSIATPLISAAFTQLSIYQGRLPASATVRP